MISDFHLIQYKIIILRGRIVTVQLLASISLICSFSAIADTVQPVLYTNFITGSNKWCIAVDVHNWCGDNPEAAFDSRMAESGIYDRDICYLTYRGYYTNGTDRHEYQISHTSPSVSCSRPTILSAYYLLGGCPSGSTFEIATGKCRLNESQCPNDYSYSSVDQLCHNTSKSNGPSTSCKNGIVDVANPINASTGNKWQHEVDLNESHSGLRFDRYYNASTTASTGTLGSGWSHAYDRSITVYSFGAWATAHRQDGKAYNFNPSGGIWTPDADVADRLEELKDGNGNLTGWHYTTADHAVESYNAEGKLTPSPTAPAIRKR